MAHYEEYPLLPIGASDVARLILDSPEKLKWLHFGEDGEYYAYLVDEAVSFAKDYTLAFETDHWLSVYDDSGLCFNIHAPKIRVYESCTGELSFLIQHIGEPSRIAMREEPLSDSVEYDDDDDDYTPEEMDEVLAELSGMMSGYDN